MLNPLLIWFCVFVVAAGVFLQIATGRPRNW